MSMTRNTPAIRSVDSDVRTVTTHLIGGAMIPSHGTEVVEVRDPKNGVLIGRVTLGDEVDASRAIAAAKAAFPGWSRTTLEERRGYLQRLADAVTARLDELTELCTAEFGAVAPFSRYAMTQARDFFILAQETLVPEHFEMTVGQARVSRVPLGVAGLLVPWNGAGWFICAKVAPALAAGCTVVVKPSNLSGLEAQVLMEAFRDAGLPPGVINVVNGRGDTVGNAITRSPDVQKISFTGSTRVGQMINRDATETMKRVTLELGGKAPTVILDDADVEGAVRFALTVGLFNSGSSCIAGTRILVPARRAAEFEAALEAGLEAQVLGDPSDPRTTVQPMITASHWERVQGYIRMGVAEGARLVTGGLGKPAGLERGHFAKPTLFADVRSAMRIAQEEIFGPVLAMIAYQDDDDAVALANDVPFGLHAYVYGANRDRARAVADRLLAGRVMINEMVDDPRAPFGGFKMSGFGREFGVAGMQSFTEPRAVFGVSPNAPASSFDSTAALEPATQKFIDSLAGAPPLYSLSPSAAHQVLTDLQSRPVPLMPADVTDTTWPVGPTGTTRIRIVRPEGAAETLPIILYCHGGGWVLGDTVTHDRLVRELAVGAHAAVVFVDYVNSPEARYPTQNEQAYASMIYAVEHARELRIDPSRLAVAGDSVGGNMSAALTLMAKERGGPRIAYQVLFYPLVDYVSERPSYLRYADGPWLITKTMQWMFDLQGLDGTEDYHAFPIRATVEQLRGLPDALVITDDDILQDEGETYALMLSQAGARVTTVRYNGTIHDFAMLNPLADTPAARGAIQQAILALRGALHPVNVAGAR